jgi:hypothetical protein
VIDKNSTNIAEAMLNIVDGDGRPFGGPVLIRIHNGQGVDKSIESKSGSNFLFKVPFHHGLGDFYAIIVSSPGYRDSGCFIKADPKVLAQPKALLLRNKPKAQFVPWAQFKAGHPDAASFLAVGDGEPAAQAHYEELGKSAPNSLACLLNLTQAMSEIDLDGRTPLSYFRQICWDKTMAQDRFFGYVDPSIIPVVRAAAARREFAEEKDCATFHPNSTCSWKQIAFPVANVQLTFHEHDSIMIDGLKCVKIEPDIDLHRDLIAHGFDEVIPNLLTGGLTDPYAVFFMRWTTAKDDNGPGFDPGYDLA